VAAVVVVLVASLTLGASGARAAPGGEPGPKDGSFHPGGNNADNHCLAPDGTTDLNEFYGVSQQIVAPFCPQADSGNFWTTTARWFITPTFESFPPGFVPTGDTPTEDFVAKFVGVKYVIDPGTKQQRTYLYENRGRLWIGDGGDAFDFPTVLVNTITVGLLKPLKAGEHSIEVYWVFNGMHCDGFPDGTVEENCLGPGDVLFNQFAFEVTAGA
jgi:hypothetical protein